MLASGGTEPVENWNGVAKPRAPVPPILPQAQDRATAVGPGDWTWPLDLKSVQLSLNPLLGHLQETQWDPRGDQGAERVHFGVLWRSPGGHFGVKIGLKRIPLK